MSLPYFSIAFSYSTGEGLYSLSFETPVNLLCLFSISSVDFPDVLAIKKLSAAIGCGVAHRPLLYDSSPSFDVMIPFSKSAYSQPQLFVVAISRPLRP